MPQDKNYLLRALVPILLIAAAIGTGYAVFKNTGQSQPPASSQPPGATQPSSPAPGPGATQAAPAPADLAPPPAPIAGLHAQSFDDAGPFEPIGDLDPQGQFMARLEFSRVGAGIASLRLARHFDTIERKPDEHTQIQREHTKQIGDLRPTLTPMAGLGISINGTLVELSGLAVDPTGLVTRPIWRQVAPGHFEAVILDATDLPVARVTRHYVLTPGSYDITLHQSVENLSAQPFTARWYQLGPVDLPGEALSYGGDKRRVRFGYLPGPSVNPGLQYVAHDDFLWPRVSAGVMGPKDATGRYPPVHPIWPNSHSLSEGYQLGWVGMTNRYFGVAVHPIVDPSAQSSDKVLHLDPKAAVDRVVLDPLVADPVQMVIGVRLNAPVARIEPGATHDLSLAMFAGPLSRPGIRKDDALAPRLVSTGIDGIVVYNFGGPCGWCTFSWITGALLWLMHLLHDWVFRDWALAIIFLVVCVRTLLHPVTKWSQIRVQRFSTQMQAMAPKQKQIQEKYAGDKKKMQEETARLWKEEGINPAGMLGCLPMFLQTPVWIALYAMLYFAFELRHEPAFFGVFQALTNNRWWFLGDLAEPDRVYYFGRTIVTIPLMGEISSINILPLILAFVFFVHQKYLAPPTTAAMTPEQLQQQKIMKWMTVIMFPVFMYNAPSGLAIYFIANSTIAIFESRYIRAHITKHDLMNPKRAGKGTGGFMKYINDIADRQRQAVQNRFGQSRPAKPGEGKGPGRPGKPGSDPPPKRFKDR
jgi:YidC/Oxa1 family membrane protein insertase